MLQGYDIVLYFYYKIVSCVSFHFIITINCCIILLPLWRIKFHIIFTSFLGLTYFHFIHDQGTILLLNIPIDSVKSLTIKGSASYMYRVYSDLYGKFAYAGPIAV